MAELKPLRGIRYDPDRVGDMAAVVAPPYDVISPAMHERLYARSPYNVVRLILNREADPHAAAATELRSWRSLGVLTEDPIPGFYFYSQTFELTRRGQQRRDGIIGAMRLDELNSGRVCPHERTLAAPRADRLGLVRACHTNLSPIFGVVSRPGSRLRDVVAPALTLPAAVDIVDDAGVHHQLWSITDPALFPRCAGIVDDQPVLIADGHHRYETALEFRDRMREAHPRAGPDAPFEFVLSCICNMEEPGVVVLPTHRVLPAARPAEVRAAVGGLAEIFEISTYQAAARERFVADATRGSGVIGCVLPDELVGLTLYAEYADAARLLPDRSAASRRLAVVQLHDLVLARLPATATAQIEYTHDEQEALAAVSSGRAGAAFLVSPPTAHDVRAVSLAGETMPQKSTYFYPKLLTGLVFHSLAV
jgi:uncharacterized protein (DUF1015 family)